MARKKRRKSSFSTSLKYEIYGIIWITLSVIAMSGEATVGRSLSKLFGALLGKFYFVIPLIGIYVGLYVMIKRKWPKGWSARKSGLVIIVVALTLMSTIWTIDQKLMPTVEVTAGRIVQQIHNDIKLELFTNASPENYSITQKQISGGYTGAVVYSVLYFLFGAAISKLVMIVLLGIGFMLTTNLSYVELLRFVRSRIARFRDLLRKKLNASEQMKRSGRAAGSAAIDKAPLIPLDEDDEEAGDLEDDTEAAAPKRRKVPVFFQLFGAKGERAKKDASLANEDEDDYGQDVLVGSRDYAARLDEPEEEADSTLIIRDFQQIQSAEQSGEEAEEELLHASRDASALDAVSYQEEEAGNETESPPFEADAENANIDGEAVPFGAEEDGHETQGTDAPQAAPPSKPYQLPSFRLLSKPQGSGKAGEGPDFMQTARKLEATLESFGVRAKVLEVVRGPAVTRYEIQPDIGVKVSRIVSLTDDIALALAAKDIRMEAPIPGKSAIGIEVPNTEVSIVTMREVMETPTFQESTSKLSIAFGRDISGQTIVGNLARMPHLLVAGATGSGKSVCINGIITSILYKAKPDEVKFLMIDPKMVELNVYNGIPHLLAPVVTDPRRASLALKKIVVEMEKRYELFSKSGTRNIEGYNKLMADNPAAVLPFIVVIVDELADLMMVAANDVEDAITRLAQMARAAGIHLIIATQRPSVDVITGVIKANIPSRIAFGVSSQVDSRTILDMGGAEKLLGRGDMLFLPMGSSKPIRVQGAFLSDQEVESVVHFVREQEQAEYNEDLVPEIDDSAQQSEEAVDELFDQAVQIVLEAKQASVSLLQRRMRIGYTRAARLIDSMEARGVVGPYEGSKPREVLITPDQFQQSRVSS